MKLLFLALLLVVVSNEVLANKAGIAWSYTEWEDSNILALSGGEKKTSWYYTWSAWAPDIRGAPLEFVPMLHNAGTVGEFDQAKGSGQWDNSKAVLGFNEPERGDQANMSPEQAVELWRQKIQPLKDEKGFRLGAPSVSSAPEGKEWFKKFMDLCSGCTIDFIPLHWYGTNGEEFTNYVKDMHNEFGNKPIWITEWASLSTDQQQVHDFMGFTTKWLDEQDYVERFSWFGAMKEVPCCYVPQVNGLLTSDGQNPSDLGKQYADKGGWE